jgi:signal transduction histidine kinase
VLAPGGVLAIVIAGVLWLFFGAMADLRAAAALERRASETTAAAAAVEKLAVDLESGVRGYLLADEDRFLEATRAARAELPARMAELERLLAADSSQAASGRELRRSIAALDAYGRKLLALERRGRLDRREAAAGGKLRLDHLRRTFDDVLARGRERAAVDRRTARDSARRAGLLVSGGLVGALGLVGLLALGVARSVSVPVRRVSDAASRLADGDLSPRVPEEGPGELRRLGAAFNAMSAALEEERRRVSEYAIELEAQQSQLERANLGLAAEKERVDALRRFGERLARETEAPAIGRVMLEALSAAGGADVGAVYAMDATEGTLRLVAALGAEPGDLPDRLPTSDGLPGLAVGERRAIAATRGHPGPASELARATGVAQELYVPLLPGDRAVGFVALGRRSSVDFEPTERREVEHLADQAAVAFSNVLSLQDARHQATINRAVVDATPDAIGLFDPSARTLLQNAAMAAVRAQVQAAANAGEEGASLASAAMDPAVLQAALGAAGADPNRTTRDEVRLGEPARHLQRYTAAVRGETGELVGRIVVLRDVSAEREAERLKEEFFALVSHELRTPLTSILGYVDLVLEDDGEDPLDPHVRRSLEVVERNARRLLRLVGDLLFVAQFEAGTLALEPGALDLGAVASQAVEAARPRARDKGVDLVLETDALASCAGDRDRLAQTFDNLISNAVKFTSPGGRVAVRVRAHGDRALVEVEDDGVGIPADEQGRLFERFFRASTATERAIPGVGLGLTIVKAIVEGHGGRIAVRSEDGAGTCFQILLPLRAPVGRALTEEVAP